MLDETMTYSCAVFERPGRAARGRAAREVRARSATSSSSAPDDHVLEIGCGWGGFAHLRRATSYGCRVTGLTISREQAVFARERTRGRPRAGRDPRAGLPHRRGQLHEGRLDRDARGDRRGPVRRRYFATIDRVLAPGGRACVQTILVPDAALGALPPHARLDRALRLPRLPDPVARGARRGVARALAARRSTASTRSARTTPRRCAAGARNFHERPSTRCARSATTGASSARGTSTSRSARPASARARCATCSCCCSAPDERLRPSPPDRLPLVHAARCTASRSSAPSGSRRAGGCILASNHESIVDPCHPRRRDDARDPLHGEVGALALPGRCAALLRLARRVPGRARRRRPGRVRRGGELLAARRGARHLPAGHVEQHRERRWHRGAARLALVDRRAARPARGIERDAAA